jgi:hypothetical protein
MGAKKIVAISLLSVILISIIVWYYNNTKGATTAATNNNTPAVGTTFETNPNIVLNDIEKRLLKYTKIESDKYKAIRAKEKAQEKKIDDMNWLEFTLYSWGL